MCDGGTSRFRPRHFSPVLASIAVLTLPCLHSGADDHDGGRGSAELHAPVRLEADGKPIDIGSLSSIAHAGPCVADVDGDGDRDLLVGDFPGYFWYFENEGDDETPAYTSKGMLQAGGEAAKTPVY
jgi:hypothetical protein